MMSAEPSSEFAGEPDAAPAEHLQTESPDEPQRLQKVLAAAGVASRRVCEQLIVAGRVEVNGQLVTELGSRVRLSDLVSVDGIAVQLDTAKRSYVLNKPRGVVSTMRDDRGRPDLRQFTDALDERVFNVGRLDTDTSGLLLLTNDGSLAQVLAHPSFGVEKSYIATVRGQLAPRTLSLLRQGIELEDGPIAIDRGKILQGSVGQGMTLVEVTLHSGRNRIVRRMFEAVGHPVHELVRRQFGPIHLGSLALGAFRPVTKVELGQLMTLARAARPSSETS